MKQERVKIEALLDIIKEKVSIVSLLRNI